MGYNENATIGNAYLSFIFGERNSAE